MSAEGTPPEERSLLAQSLAGLTWLVLRFPVTTLLLAGLALVAAMYLSGTRLTFRTSRLDLLNPKSEFNCRWINYIEEFGDAEDVVVVLEGPNRTAIDPAAREIVAALEAQPQYFHSVLYEIDCTRLQQKGLYYLEPAQLRQVVKEVEFYLDNINPVLHGDWSLLQLGNLDPQVFAQLRRLTVNNSAAQAAAQTHLAWFTRCLLQALRGEYQSPWSELNFVHCRPRGTVPFSPTMQAWCPENGDSPRAKMGTVPSQKSGQSPSFHHRLCPKQYLVESEQLGLILLRLTKDKDAVDFVRNAEGIERLREILQQLQRQHGAVKIGLTGLPIIEYDEMNSSKISMAEVSLIALFGVSLLFIVGFGGWRHPLLAVVSLTVGTAWAMGYVALSIGHLNILSSAFAVILIGQGIDFSMYFVAEYLQQRTQKGAVPFLAEGDSPIFAARKSGQSPGARKLGQSPGERSRKALLKAVRRVGPGVFIGAVTTAAAFFMAGLTEFTGVAELGIIAGGGILLCWLAGATILPASIHLIDSRWPMRHVPAPVDVISWIRPLLAKPLPVLAVTTAGTMLLGFGLTRLWYDHNLLHLQARGLESVSLEKKLAAEDDLSASYAVSITASPEEARRRAAQFMTKPSVKRVREIVSLLPRGDDLQQKQALAARLHRRLERLPHGVPQIPVTPPQNLRQLLLQMRQYFAGQSNFGQFQGEFDQIAALLARMTPSEYHAKISAYQQRLAEDLLVNLQNLRAATVPQPPRLSDLPPSLVARFVSPRGRYLTKIYSRGDIWDMTAMEQFVREVREVDPEATGNPLQVYEASRQMKRSYEQAALLALTVILPVVYLDFRSLRAMFLALLPLGLGMLQMFGLMGLLDIPLNAANMIVLPLILGVGIDAGVHIVHDFRSQRGPYQMNAAIASAVVINQVTNMAGFGALMIATHQGLQSLGRVLVLGMSSCLFSSLVILPALLTWLTRNRRTMPETAERGLSEMTERPPSATFPARWESETGVPVPHFRYDPAAAPLGARPGRPLSEFWPDASERAPPSDFSASFPTQSDSASSG